jgi:phosphoglucosamine mutase
MKIAVDCANGATTTVAPQIFAHLGFDASFIGVDPDGRNINLDCGSTHPEGLSRRVVEGGFEMGIAFDGDGDRAIFVDASGAMCRRRRRDADVREGAEGRGEAQRQRRRRHGHEQHRPRDRAARGGMGIVRCPVGDKYVMEEMLRRGLSLGGEQSGHVIFADYLFTGDGWPPR